MSYTKRKYDILRPHDAPPLQTRREQSAAIDAAVADFIARGGAIKPIPTGVSGYQHNGKPYGRAEYPSEAQA